MRKIVAVPKWAQIYGELRRQIRTCELAPGSSVSELSLARIYKCSPTPIRDALNRLRQEGLIVGEVPRRQIVAPLTLGDIRSLGETRAVLESGCVRLLFSRGQSISTEKIEKLREIAAGTLQSAQSRTELIATNRIFHMALAELTGNDRLISLVAKVLDDSERIFQIGIDALPIREMEANHLGIIDAIARRDFECAITFLEAEAYGTRDRVINLLLQPSSLLDSVVIRQNDHNAARQQQGTTS